MARDIAFDVETPNRANDRISAIGITVVENGAVIQQYGTLVDPEVNFEAFHMQLTGITPDKVAGAPNFWQLWPQIALVLESGLLVAHNAPFDMGVLARCLWAYGISWKDQVAYACTCQLARRCFPQLKNHKLDTLCESLGIFLDHHRAESDSAACAQLLLACQRSGAKVEDAIKLYDMRSFATLPARRAAPQKTARL